MSPIALNVQNWENEVVNAEGLVLVDFWASWCGPCRMLGPIVDRVAEAADGFKVGKVNVDEEPELARQFNITNIPCLVVLKNGVEVNRSVGLISQAQVEALVKG